MNKSILKSAHFKLLKGLNDATICFSDSLTAIMGVNGAGKTTVIHALACAFKPEKSNSFRYKFPNFFIPNSDSLWKKDLKNVYYIGIESCLPEIEKITANSRIIYKTTKMTQKIDEKTIKEAAYILNKEYESLLDNDYYGKHLIGVELNSGLKYSSLSMGTGEQRIIKMLKTILSAEAYSIILIDEIDLLLHVSALKRLIVKLDEIAKRKHLQIVFTTHSIEMLNMQDYVRVQYITNH